MKPYEQQTYYELLEVPPSASVEEIRAAYVRAIETYSPDSVALYALDDPEQLERLRSRLTEALERLSEPRLRREYDRTLGLALSAAAAADAGAAGAAPSVVHDAAAGLRGVAGEADEAEAEAEAVAAEARPPPEPHALPAPVAQPPPVAPTEARPVAPEAPARPAPARTATPAVYGTFSGYQIAYVSASASTSAAPSGVVLTTPLVAPVGVASVAGKGAGSAPPAPRVEPVPPAPAPSPVVAAAPPAPVAPAPMAPVPAAVVPVPAAPAVAAPVAPAAMAAPLPAAAPEDAAPAPVAASVAAVPTDATPAVDAAPVPAAPEPTSTPAEAPAAAAEAPAAAPTEEAGLAVTVRLRDPARADTGRNRIVELADDVEFNGEVLRRVREAKGMTLQALCDRTRISSRHLENVEADRYKDLPAAVYLRGMLMSISRELGLDGLRVSRSYLALVAARGGSGKW